MSRSWAYSATGFMFAIIATGIAACGGSQPVDVPLVRGEDATTCGQCRGIENFGWCGTSEFEGTCLPYSAGNPARVAECDESFVWVGSGVATRCTAAFAEAVDGSSSSSLSHESLRASRSR
jgi:hypothetical protein